MKTILIREVDRLYSKIHKDKYVSEYIIYLMENDVKLKAINVVGNKSKDNYLLAMLLTNDFGDLTEQEIIQEVSFEEVIKNQ
jgi:hypothetical protein